MNALQENLSGIWISTSGDMFLGEKVPRFIVSQVNANISVDLIGSLKATNFTKVANNTCRCGFGYSRNREKKLVFWQRLSRYYHLH